MAVYAYKTLDVDRSPHSGTIVADSPRQARDLLRERGLTVIDVAPFQSAGRSRRLLGRRRKAQAEVVSFIRELATLLRAGIPLLKALQTLQRQHRGRFRAVLQTLADRVGSGVSLAEAMALEADYFDPLCVSIVRVGEHTGALEEALGRLAAFKEKARRLRSKVGTALLYPAFVCAVGMIVALFLMSFVVPKILGTLAESGRELPAITRLVKSASDLLLNWWWVLALAVGVGILALRWTWRHRRGRLVADRLLLRLPLVGELLRKEIVSRMAIVMAALLRSGLHFVEAVRTTSHTVGNRVFVEALATYEQAVASGRDVAGPLEETGVFSPVVVQMLAVGQQAGNLEEMLEQLAETYQHEVDTATARLTAVLEPLLVVTLAIFVGIIAFATILPILELSNVY